MKRCDRLSLLCLVLLVSSCSQLPHVCLAQQQQQQQQHQQQRKHKQRPSNSNGSNSNSNSNAYNDNDTTFNFDHAKQKFGEFFEDKQDALQYYKMGPKHIGEGLWNTVLVSGTATLVGVASVIGFPILTLFGGDISTTAHHRGRFVDRLIRLVVGGIVGGTIASVVWTGGLVYGGWQILTGLYRTPATLVAQLEGRVYYNEHINGGTWQIYNLTEHAQALNQRRGGRFRKGGGGGGSGIGVQDDSLYQILQINTDASSKEIKRAYYKLAKEYHPDKVHKKTTTTTTESSSASISEEEEEQQDAINDRFLKLHRAYETLYDPQKRKAYDEWGLGANDDNNNNAAMPFDSDVFFDILFGFSPELEPYIGDLAIKSFSSNILHLIIKAQSASSMQGQSASQQEEMLNQLFASFILGGQDRRDLRQVEIAIYLQNFSKEFVEGTMDLDQFSIKCQQEAQAVFESTPFPLFLQSIGKALYWQGRGAFVSWWNLPIVAMAWTRERTLALKNASWLKLAKLIRQIPAQHAKATEWVEEERRKEQTTTTTTTTTTTSSRSKTKNQYSEHEWQSLQFNKVMEFLIPSLMEFVWDYNQNDIAFTLKGATWKLLHDHTHSSSRSDRVQHRGRQAQALQVLGGSFLRYADEQMCLSMILGDENNENAHESESENDNERRLKECISNGSSGGDFLRDQQSRIQKAVEMATRRSPTD